MNTASVSVPTTGEGRGCVSIQSHVGAIEEAVFDSGPVGHSRHVRNSELLARQHIMKRVDPDNKERVPFGVNASSSVGLQFFVG